MVLTRHSCTFYRRTALRCASQSKQPINLRDNVKRNVTFSSREVFESRNPSQVSELPEKEVLGCLDSRQPAPFTAVGIRLVP